MMQRVGWVLNRLAAASAGAAAVGGFAGLMMAAYGELTHPTSPLSSDFWTGLLFLVFVTAFFSVWYGTLPGLVALTLTPAKTEPWRRLRVLVPASLAGFAFWFGIGNVSPREAQFPLLILLPTITGLATAFAIGGVPPRRHA
jgi:hypothetical protein